MHLGVIDATLQIFTYHSAVTEEKLVEFGGEGSKENAQR